MSEPAVEIRGLVKRFGGFTAVNDLSFSVEAGQTYGLIGPNGAGKTTTFAILCGYLRPTAGSARVMGADPQVPGALKRKVGVLPQDAVLTPGERVGTLLTYFARLSRIPSPELEAMTVLKRVGLPEAWDVQAQSLSHGMAKRVALAQALMGSPPVVMLDEPTAGLDPRIAAQVREIIREMKGKQTVIVSSHNLQELEELCDAAAILDHGKLVQAGSMTELTAQAGEFRVQIARGDVPLAEIRQLKGVTTASFDAGWLAIEFNPQALSPEEAIPQTVRLLLEKGVLILSVTRGRRLEERVLQLT